MGGQFAEWTTMYQSRDATAAVDSTTTTESAKEKNFAHYAQDTTV